MNFYLIAYDLNEEGQKYKEIRNEIEELGDSVFEQSSVAVLYSQYDECYIAKKLRAYIDYNDRLFITKIKDCVSINMNKTMNFIDRF